MRLDGLRLQLLGLFVLPVTLVVLAVAVLSTQVHRSAMRELVASRDQRAAASAAAAVDEALRSRLSLVEVVVAHVSSGELSEVELQADESLTQAFPLGVTLFDQNGQIRGSSAPHQILQLINFQRLVGSPDKIILAESDGERIVLFLGREEGYLAVGAASLTDLMRSAAPGIASPHSEASTYLVAPDNELLIALGGSVPSDLADHSAVQAVLRGEQGSTFTPLPDGEHLVAFAPIPITGWGLVIEEPWHSVTSSVLDLSLLAPFTLVPVLLLTILALWFGARRVIEPLRQLEQAAADFPGGDLDAIAETEGGIAEIQQLRATLVRMAERVREARDALRGYIGAITAAQEEERRRVARELHDESIQHWIALDQRLQLAAGRLREQDNLDLELIAELRGAVQSGITELRRISRGLRPLYLEDLGLSPAVEMLALEAQESLAVPVRFQVKGEPKRLSPQAELAVYRLVQEGLANIGRHADPSSVQITFDYQPDRLDVSVRDDGGGFDPPAKIEELAAAGHYGLMGMVERADSIDGRLTIDSQPGHGTTLRLSVPFRGV